MKLHSLSELFEAYNDNKHIIKAYINNQSVEGFPEVNNQEQLRLQLNGVAMKQQENTSESDGILGMGIALFLTILAINLALWIWALVLLVRYWSVIPDWAKIIGIIGVLPIIPGGAIITIIVMYVVEKKNKTI